MNSDQQSDRPSEFERMEAIRDEQRKLIEDYGYSKIAVFDPKGDDVIFVYTVGLELKNQPELICAALFESEDLSHFIDHFATAVVNDGAQPIGMVKENAFTLLDDTSYDLRVVEIDAVQATEKWLKQASSVLRQPVTRVAHVQISDAAKLWPGDPGFNNKFKQPFIATVINKGSGL